MEPRTAGEAGMEPRTAVRKRAARGLLAGLWEFPNVEGTLDEAGAAAVLDGWGLTASAWESRLTAKHIFTHVEWRMTGYVIRVTTRGKSDSGAGEAIGDSTDSSAGKADAFRWIDRRELDEYAIPSAFARFRERAAAALDTCSPPLLCEGTGEKPS